MTTTHVRLSSLVKRFPPLRPRKIKKYRLVYNHQEQSYNGGVEFDIEDSEFNVPQDLPVIRDLARRLADVSKAIGRVYCFDQGRAINAPNFLPRGSTTGFYINILTTSDLMEDENGELSSHTTLDFYFTLRISAKECMYTSTPLGINNKNRATSTTNIERESDDMFLILYSPNNTDPSYLNATSICVVGYCDGITVSDAMSDYLSLPDNIRAFTPPPTVADVESLPKDHKSLFYGRILAPVLDAPVQYCVTVSMHHGICGSPVFCSADSTKFIGVVLRGSEITDCNIILTVLSNEFDTIFAAIKERQGV